MKILSLVRHANASRNASFGIDYDRPLTARGRADARRMGKRCAKRGYAPELLITSPALRARTTARVMAKELAYAPGKIQKYAMLYDAGVADIRRVIRSTPESVRSLMLVGHNPGLQTFIEYLTGKQIDAFPTAAICVVRIKARSWKAVGRKAGAIDWFSAPASEARNGATSRNVMR